MNACARTHTHTHTHTHTCSIISLPLSLFLSHMPNTHTHLATHTDIHKLRYNMCVCVCMCVCTGVCVCMRTACLHAYMLICAVSDNVSEEMPPTFLLLNHSLASRLLKASPHMLSVSGEPKVSCALGKHHMFNHAQRGLQSGHLGYFYKFMSETSSCLTHSVLVFSPGVSRDKEREKKGNGGRQPKEREREKEREG